jgi:DNA repair exonuclease SbcCD ATPase subunit
MAIANQIKSLTEDIEAGYGARVAAVADIISEVRKMRTNNVKDLKEMAKSLAEFLSSAEKERIEEFTTLIGEIRRAVEAISKDTAKTLAAFRTSHTEMSQAQRAKLLKITKERIEEVSTKLSEFGREHQEMARQLGEELSSFQKKLERAVDEMRAPVIADLKQAKRNWQNLVRVMAAKRAGKPIPAAKAEMGVSKEIKGELNDRVLKVIQAYPGGITLAEIGRALGVAYVQISKPIKHLLAEMVVTKRDSEYFPT